MKPNKKIGVLMLNMGGPRTIKDVKPFLSNLFSDKDLIQSNSHFALKFLSRFIVSRRLSEVQKQYEKIGGGSPILKWTDFQGEAISRILNERHSPRLSFRHYVCFRYAFPTIFDNLDAMKADGIEHAIAVSQYPQYSCATTGSNLNHIWAALEEKRMSLQFKWSLIDRWPTEEFFVQTLCSRIKEKMGSFRDFPRATILFSGHSLPLKTVYRGDSYVHEIHQTIGFVMRKLYSERILNRFAISWQSKVGPMPWQGPPTDKIIEGLARDGVEEILVVPLAFTCDHIETLYEIGETYKKIAQKAGVKTFQCTEGFNGSPVFIKGMADLIEKHLEGNKNFSDHYKSKCAGCWQPEECRRILSPAF